MTRPLRVAIASSGLGHVSRGIETWAADLAAALHERTVPVALFQGGGEVTNSYARILSCLPREGSENARWAGRVPQALGWRLGLQAGYPLEQTTFAWSLAGELRRARIDILHVQDPLVALHMERLRGLGWIRTKTILAHGTEEPVDFLRRFEFLQHLAPTHLERCRALGAWRPGWTAIGNFVDINRFRPGKAPDVRRALGIPDDAFVVLTLAAIKRHHKRIDWLVESVGRFKEAHPEVPIVLVVAGGREDETTSVIAEGEARLGGSVRFLVKYPRDGVPDLLRAADLFVLASLFEMMPIALLEAGASGLPCVTHHEATLEWMTGPGGVRVDMQEPAALIETLFALWSDAGRRLTVGRAAREHTMSNFGTVPILSKILEYYAHVAGAGHSAGAPG